MYQLEKDFIFSNLYDYIIKELNKNNESNNLIILENNYSKGEMPLLILPYIENYSFPKQDMQIKINLPKRNFLKKSKGITKKLLQLATLNNDILIVIALDIFFANFDKHQENILIQNNNLILIDHEGCFQIPYLGLDILKSIKKNDYSREELETLKKINTILKKIEAIIDHDEIIDILKNFLKSNEKENRILPSQIEGNIRIHKHFFLEIKKFIDSL